MSHVLPIIVTFIISVIILGRVVSTTLTANGQMENVQDKIIAQVDNAYRMDTNIAIARNITKITGPELYKLLVTRQIKYYVVFTQLNRVDDIDIEYTNHIGKGEIYTGRGDEDTNLRKLITEYGGSTFYMVELDRLKNVAIFCLNYDIKDDYKIKSND